MSFCHSYLENAVFDPALYLQPVLINMRVFSAELAARGLEVHLALGISRGREVAIVDLAARRLTVHLALNWGSAKFAHIFSVNWQLGLFFVLILWRGQFFHTFLELFDT